MNTLTSYLVWHYGDGLKRVARNAVLRVAGFLNYFSVAELGRTLFSPWHRIRQPYGRGLLPARFLSGLIVNLFSRIIGAVVRAVVIVAGLVASFAAGLFGVAAIFVWLVVPGAIPALALFGAFILVIG